MKGDLFIWYFEIIEYNTLHISPSQLYQMEIDEFSFEKSFKSAISYL